MSTCALYPLEWIDQVWGISSENLGPTLTELSAAGVQAHGGFGTKFGDFWLPIPAFEI